MNYLNTLLVNEQLIRLKGETLSFAKVQQQHNAGCKHRFVIEWLKKWSACSKSSDVSPKVLTD